MLKGLSMPPTRCDGNLEREHRLQVGSKVEGPKKKKERMVIQIHRWFSLVDEKTSQLGV